MANTSALMNAVSGDIPVDTQAYISRIHIAVLRTEKTLKPSFLKSLMGETNRDKERTVVSDALEQTRLGRKHLSNFSQQCEDLGRSGGTDYAKYEALSGLIRRVIKRIDDWRDWAFKFEDNEIDSRSMLLEKSSRISKLLQSSFPSIDLPSRPPR